MKALEQSVPKVDLLTVAGYGSVNVRIYGSHRYFKVKTEAIASTSKNIPNECMATTVTEVVTHRDGREVKEAWRRQCGCLKTSDKLKELLKCFPPPPPPTPATPTSNRYENTCVSAYCTHLHQPGFAEFFELKEKQSERLLETRKAPSKPWSLISDFVQVVQMSVMATALAFYYVIYCYMQMVYYTLRSALFFHNADGPMKITIGVMTITSLIVGFNLLLRMERLFGISWWKH